MTAADVIGKYLIAEQDVKVYAYPGGPALGVVQKGLVVGPVYSWVEKNGVIYWAFDYTIPGNPPASYYAPHSPANWKLSSTGQQGGSTSVSISPAIKIPTWAYVAGAGLLAVLLLKK